jgi:hypothetical protein
MKPPYAYEDARRTAPIHAQVRVLSMKRQPHADGSARILALVVRVFRDDVGALWFAKPIRFSVPIIPSDAETEIMLGGTIRHDWHWIRRAKWLEVFLCCSNGRIELVESQLAPIRRPTLHPVCGLDQKGFCCTGNI